MADETCAGHQIRRMRKMKRRIIAALLATTMAVALTVGCDIKDIEKVVSQKSEKKEDTSAKITIGFSQVGVESDWRLANTDSMKKTFSEENGYKLIVKNGEQKQENQIASIQEFIKEKVDYIVLAPVTEDGWDDVLKEAKDAGIPVIVIDRMVDVSDDSLYTTWIGSDFTLESKKVCAWLKAYAEAKGMKEINIAHIQGTEGASAQIGRTDGLESAAKEYGWNIVATKTGEFTKNKGREAMEAMLKEKSNINVVYCENDNEAAGAIEAIEAAGKTVGPDGDILVLSFDATDIGLKNVQEGKIACDAECNPLHGPRVEDVIKKLEKKEKVDQLIYVEEGVFAYDDTVTSVKVGEKEYTVTPVKESILDERVY